ncbi:hypothetical protein BDV93DRAFT_522244 [Ceratobasidium sp. AG-I]|nr:hypothetical protein BDV93DRAFT_522244 [Ceratobasidium sp. AG-I]
MSSPPPPAYSSLPDVQVSTLSKVAYPTDLSDNPFVLGPTGMPLHPELRSVLRLNTVHQQKVYYSGRLLKRLERDADGTRTTKDEWTDVWCQLGGVTLSSWSMKEVEEAAAKGEEVPPQYVNITDAFVSALGALTFPATSTTPARRFTNVLTLNTAGSNLLLFVCESTAALVSWAAALRLASWEKSRLEEIYTAHLLRVTPREDQFLKEKEKAKAPHTSLVRGKFEGWARVRVADQTNWQRLWVIITDGTAQTHGASGSDTKKCRLSGLFPHLSHGYVGSSGPTSWNKSSQANPNSSPTHINDPPMIYFHTSNKPKELRTPILSVSSVSQAFAVYPERPNMITRSTLVKIEGRLGTEEGAGAIHGAEAWVLVMPEVESGQIAGPRKMLEWVVALHDAFRLYGRPARYSYNPHGVDSLMFAYPVDPSISPKLFLSREVAESLDPREDATSITRSRLTTLLEERMRGAPKRDSPSGSSLSTQATLMNQPVDKNIAQYGAQDQLDGTNPFVSSLDSQLVIDAHNLAPTSTTKQSATGENISSSSGWVAQQQQSHVSTSTGGGPGANLFVPKDITAPEATLATPSPLYRQSAPMSLYNANMGLDGPSRQDNQSASAAVHEPSTSRLLYARPSALHSPYAPTDLLTGSPRTPTMTFSQPQTVPYPATGAPHSGIPGPTSPVMINPMMTGMGWMPNMGAIGGFSPQQQFHMWIAQQVAAETYQRTMMALSQAGLVGSGEQEDGRGARPMSGQWGMMGMGMPWMGINPMMMGGGMGMMPSFGGFQSGGGMGGMDMQGMSGTGPMDSLFECQGRAQGNPTAPAHDSEGYLVQNGSPPAGSSSQQ